MKALEIIKDLFISILIVACLIFVLGVVFYDKISLGKVIPESQDYELSKEMQEELKETNLDNSQEVIVNYYIKATDLNKYEKTNEYVKGKSNPFAAESTDPDNTISGDNNTSDNNNSSSEGFYEDDGTK